MNKKITSLILLAVCLLMCFTACGNKLSYALSINGTEVTEGVYTYYLDSVLANPDEFDLTAENYEEDAKAAATELVKKYIAINTMTHDLSVTLSYSAKAEIAEDTDSYWDFFSDHYEKIGITKQDINKIITSDKYEMALLDYYYGEGSKISPVSTKKLKNAFTQKYVGVKIIAAPLTTTDTLGSTVALDDIELKNTRTTFENMKNKANNGTDIDSVYSSYNSAKDLIGTESLETFVFTKDSARYSNDFFAQVIKLDYNKATVFESEDTIYLLYRVDITGEEYNYFLTYKEEVLADLKLADLEKKIASKSKKYEVDEYSSKINKIYDRIIRIHPAETTTPAQ